MHTERVASPLKFLAHPWELISNLWESPPNIPQPVGVVTAPTSPVLVTAGSGSAIPSFDAVGNSVGPLSAADQTLAPHGLCGWVSAEPGTSGNFVCQAMGQVMPGVVFMVSLVVLTATLFFLVRYLLRSAKIASDLEEVAAAFEKMSSVPGEWARKETWDIIHSRLLLSGKASPPIQEFANRMQTSIVPISSADDQRVVLKESASDLAWHVRKTDRWSGQSLAEALPGWLTAIGLLTTFLAILLGLQGVKVLTNLEVRGIGGLVNGLSGKFFSSIVALGCAITITITHYFVSGSTNRRWDRLVDRIQDLVPHLSVERVFMQLLNSGKSER